MDIKGIIVLVVRLYLRYSCKDVLLQLGSAMVLAGVASLTPLTGWSWSFGVDFKDWPTLSLIFGQDGSVVIGTILILLGLGIVIFRLHQLNQKSVTIQVYLKGYDNMEESAPSEALPAKYRYGQFFRQNCTVRDKSPQDALYEIKQIPNRIAEYAESNGITEVRVIFSGRAFVPLQYAAGRVLGTRAGFEVMDFDRETGRWHFLDALDDGERIKLLDPANAERVKESRQAALVLPFTANISNEQLPEGLRDVAYRFELKRGPRQDSMASREKMEAILKTVNQFIRNLRAQVDVLHVFAAVSTSTAVRLGCLFQNNIYPETRVYQFDTCTGGYPWALRLLADKMEIIEGRPDVQSQVAVG